MKRDYVAVIYDRKIRPVTQYPDQLAEYLCRRFSIARGSKLLDVGFGRGDFLRALGRRGLRVAGVDQSEAALKECGDLEVKACVAGREALPFPDSSFDVVFHKSLLEHLENPEPLMDESMRVLRPGGQLIVLVPDWISQMGIFYDDHTHRRPYTAASLHDLMVMTGFKQCIVERFYQLPILWRFPLLKIISKALQKIIRPEHRPQLSFIRWSVELMVLGSAQKPL